MAQLLWRRRFLKLCQMIVFLLFHHYLPLKKGRVPLSKEALCQVCLKYALEWFCWRLKIYFNLFFSISLLSPIGEGQGLSFEQTWVPFTHGCFVTSLDEICPVVLDKILLICYYLPLEKGRGSSAVYVWVPFTQGCFVPSFLKFAQLFWRRRRKC